MPGGDHTGPRGMGPKTGRAAGYCAGYDAPGWMNNVPGRGGGYGYGRGGGRGMGFRGGGRGGFGRGGGWGWRTLQPPVVPEGQRADEATAARELEEQLKHLQAQLSELSDRIRDLAQTRPQAEEDK